MNHLLARHPDYEQVVQSMTADTLVVYACSDKAKTVFGWLEWLVDGVCDEAGSRGSSNAWSSAFDMLDRFLKIRARARTVMLQIEDPVVLPTAAQEGTTVADVRAIFDDVIAEIPDTTHHLNSTAAIVKHAPFENALVKIQRGQGGELTAAELKAAQNLIVTDESEEIDVDAETGLGFAARALQRRRIAEQQEHRFMDTVFLEPTSNSVEWLFSTAKLLFSDKRKRLLPKTLEQLLFLCAKRDLWGLGEVAKVVDHVDRRSS
ncbi:hypothetical protein PC123_g15316 [Phytophthora cactorum]|nr:hypothetical protein PC123_g15316 [Phytophthora cactorum]